MFFNPNTLTLALSFPLNPIFSLIYRMKPFCSKLRQTILINIGLFIADNTCIFNLKRECNGTNIDFIYILHIT